MRQYFNAVLACARQYAWVAFVLWSFAALVLGYSVHTLRDYYSHDYSGQEFRAGMRGLTNPLLECDVAADTIQSRKEDFTSELRTFTDLLKTQQRVSQIAVYYRDLNNGPVISVDAGEPFAPASLLKLPIMMAYLARAESDQSSLDTLVPYTKQSFDLPEQTVKPDNDLVVGQSYSIRELIQHMILYSDNNAMKLLYDRLPLSEQVDLYSLLGVDPSVLSDTNATLSVRQYSTFLRILFNASYLSRKNSEWALKILTETTFNRGLRAGVPQETLVAHKFGERKFDSGLQQFHDCGIVYYPNHPYLLCVMTRGSDSDSLIGAIADTSAFVYKKIDLEYGQ